jgi:hypothetical protein
MIFDFWELSEGIAALFIIMVFGVIFYSWELMIPLLGFCLVASPLIKKRNNKGVFFHWPYRHLGIALPGLINPKRRKKYSD